MKEILEIIITNLVEDKSAVKIEEILDGDIVTYKVEVSESDMGKVIGKRGRIAKAVRTVTKAIALKENKKINIEFVD